jgi:glutathione S-transferase
MMKLYYSPGACSLSPHIALLEAGLPFELVLASTKTHKLKDGTDYYGINSKGYVPLLELDDGQRLSEGPAIVQYIADQAPASGLAPANGTMGRYRLQEWLNFITSELHKSYTPLFNPAMPEEAKAIYRGKLRERYVWIDGQLAGDRSFLLGEHFTVADGYLFTVQNWSHAVDVDLSGLPAFESWRERVRARPAVQAALESEGLVKKS